MKRFLLAGISGLLVTHAVQAAPIAGAVAAQTERAGTLAQTDRAMTQAQNPVSPTTATTTYEDGSTSTSTTKPTTPTAAAPKSFYISIGGGPVYPTKNTYTNLPSNTIQYSPTPAGTGNFNLPRVHWANKYYDAGYEANIALGSLVSNKLRIEAEALYQNLNRKISGTYNWREVSVVSGNTYAASFNNPIGPSSKRAKVYSLLANGYYDFKNSTKWTPILGAGIGVAWMRSPKSVVNGTLAITDLTASTVTTVNTTATSPSLSGAAFAYQMKAGVAYELTKSAALALQYRFYGTTEFQASTNSVQVGSGRFTVGQQNTSSLRNSSVDLSLRYLLW